MQLSSPDSSGWMWRVARWVCQAARAISLTMAGFLLVSFSGSGRQKEHHPFWKGSPQRKAPVQDNYIGVSFSLGKCFLVGLMESEKELPPILECPPKKHTLKVLQFHWRCFLGPPSWAWFSIESKRTPEAIFLVLSGEPGNDPQKPPCPVGFL